jgi:hypothetical protein
MSSSATLTVVADVCGVASGVFGVVGYFPDIVRTWRKIAKPPRLTWFLWTAQDAVLLSSQLVKGGVGFWLCLPAFQLLGTAVVAVLSVRATGGRLDPVRSTAAAGAAGSALALWWGIGNAVVALVVIVVLQSAEMLVIAWHAFQAPHEETMWIWRGCAAGGALGIIAVLPTRSAVLALYPVCFTVMAVVVIVAYRIGRARVISHGRVARRFWTGPLLAEPVRDTAGE